MQLLAPSMISTPHREGVPIEFPANNARHTGPEQGFWFSVNGLPWGEHHHPWHGIEKLGNEEGDNVRIRSRRKKQSTAASGGFFLAFILWEDLLPFCGQLYSRRGLIRMYCRSFVIACWKISARLACCLLWQWISSPPARESNGTEKRSANSESLLALGPGHNASSLHPTIID